VKLLVAGTTGFIGCAVLACTVLDPTVEVSGSEAAQSSRLRRTRSVELSALD